MAPTLVLVAVAGSVASLRGMGAFLKSVVTVLVKVPLLPLACLLTVMIGTLLSKRDSCLVLML